MIAVLLATYNGEKYIKEMLDSLEAQSYGDFICYVHDDGSKDGTIEIIKEWIKKTNNSSKYKIMRQPIQGSAKDNFMLMLNKVNADYYMFADQDDVWLPQKIELTIKRMEGVMLDKNIPTCVFSDMRVVDENLNTIADSFIRHIGRNPKVLKYQRIMIDNPAAGCTMMINKALRDIAIKLSDTSLIEMHDGYMASLASAGGIISCIDEPLVLYRQHSSNVMGASKGNRIKRLLSSKREYHMHEVKLARALLATGMNFPESAKKTLKALSVINNSSKCKRICFYKKNGFDRDQNNLWFLLWV